MNIINNSNSLFDLSNFNSLSFYLITITSGIELKDLDLILNGFIKYKLELNKIISEKNKSIDGGGGLIDLKVIAVFIQFLSINSSQFNNSNINNIHNSNSSTGVIGFNNTLYQLKIEVSKLLVQLFKFLKLKKEEILDVAKHITNHCHNVSKTLIEFSEISSYLPFFKGIEEYLECDYQMLYCYCKSLECISRISRNQKDVLMLLKCGVFEEILKRLYKSNSNEIQELCLKFILNILDNGSDIDIQKLIDLELFSKMMFLLLNFFNNKTCSKLQVKRRLSGNISGISSIDSIDSSIGSSIGSIGSIENIDSIVNGISGISTQNEEREESIIVTGRTILKKIILSFCNAIFRSNISQFYYFDQVLNCFHFLQVYLLKFQLLDQLVTDSVINSLNYMAQIILPPQTNQ